MAFVNEAGHRGVGAQSRSCLRNTAAAERGQGYKQEKAITGQEGPDLQMHVWSAWCPAAHRAGTDTLNLPGQVPSQIVDLGTRQLRQALRRALSSCPP